MRLALRIIIAFSAFTVAQSAANAASITSTLSKEGKVIVSIVGQIAEGDADTLKGIIKSTNYSGRLVSGVRLNSPGGSVLEGTSSLKSFALAK